MTAKPHITRSDFANAFAHLVMGRHLLPKKHHELQMLLLSTILNLDLRQNYREKEINDELRAWISRFGQDLSTDHVTLRRYLVDESLLSRDPSGTTYTLNEQGQFFSFDSSIRQLDLGELIVKAEAARATRKRAHLAASTEQ